MRSNHQKTANDIESLLVAKLSPDFIQVTDDSEAHSTHKEAMKNPDKGHFHVKINSSSVKGATLLEKHRLIYDTISPIMRKIHACKITLVD